jgi:IclR family transcriptional regulator, pca regulon regulatory protein
MAGRGTGPEFVEALARGLDVLTAFSETRPEMSLAEVAAETGSPAPPPGGCC